MKFDAFEDRQFSNVGYEFNFSKPVTQKPIIAEDISSTHGDNPDCGVANSDCFDNTNSKLSDYNRTQSQSNYDSSASNYDEIFSQPEGNLRNWVRKEEQPRATFSSKQTCVATSEIPTPKANSSNDLSMALDSIFGGDKPTQISNSKFSVKKDVLNKNILRVMSRYFKNLMKNSFSNLKQAYSKPDVLESILEEFMSKLFPSAPSNSPFKYILGAFALATKIKKLPLDSETMEQVQLVHKCLSTSYSGKSLQMLFKNQHAAHVFDYFRKNGMDFFSKEGVVTKNRSSYEQALNEFQLSFDLTSDANSSEF